MFKAVAMVFHGQVTDIVFFYCKKRYSAMEYADIAAFTSSSYTAYNALVISFPEVGDPGLMWEKTGTLWGFRNTFLPLWWEKSPFQLRGDWERSIVHLIDGKMAKDRLQILFFFIAKKGFQPWNVLTLQLSLAFATRHIMHLSSASQRWGTPG